MVVTGSARRDARRRGRLFKETCHVPHEASGEIIWMGTPGRGTFTGIAPVCNCYDGTVAGGSCVFDVPSRSIPSTVRLERLQHVP
jgi:hypothetical protein